MSAVNYLFTSERLGFRTWNEGDKPMFNAMNADPEVMRHFPSGPLSEEASTDFLVRLEDHYQKYGHQYFAADLLASGETVGFVGLAYQTYESPFTPAVDIGWRLKRSAWGKGYATEGAKVCLAFGFNTLDIDHIISTCIPQNQASENIMQKIGMKKVGEFDHPKLMDHPTMKTCVVYRINKEEYLNVKK